MDICEVTFKHCNRDYFVGGGHRMESYDENLNACWFTWIITKVVIDGPEVTLTLTDKGGFRTPMGACSSCGSTESVQSNRCGSCRELSEAYL